MVNKFILIILVVMGLVTTAHSDCSNAQSEAYDGYRYAKKAYKSLDLDRCQRYARKSYRHAYMLKVKQVIVTECKSLTYFISQTHSVTVE